jgi:hypothetical protein
MRKNASRKPAQARKTNMRRGGMIPHPPQLPSYGITRDVRLRFSQLAAGTTNITFQNLLDAIAVCTSTTTAADLFEAVRVNSVELWALAAIGTPATVTLSFDGTTAGAQGDQKTHTDTSMGIEPAHVKAKPDPLTQAGQFQASQASVAFILTVPAGTVIDVSLTLRQPVIGRSMQHRMLLSAGLPARSFTVDLTGRPQHSRIFQSWALFLYFEPRVASAVGRALYKYCVLSRRDEGCVANLEY